jgi:hypothetical protein
LEHAQAAIRLAEKHNFPLFQAIGTCHCGWALAQRGEKEEAIRMMEQGLADAVVAWGSALGAPPFLALLAEMYGRFGQPNEGLETLKNAFVLIDQIEGHSWAEPELTHLLSVIISKATRTETEKFAKENLFEPLAISNYKWEKLKDGYNDGGGLSLWMKTDDLAKIGQLLLNNGEMNMQQIVSKQWVNMLFEKENKLKTSWGLKNSLHGFCWYATTYKDQPVNYSMGYGGQFIFIFPNLNSVVAINHNHDTPNGIEQSNQFFEKYLPIILKELKK